MPDSVFEAFDRIVEEPEEQWASLAAEAFPNDPGRVEELMRMLAAWKKEPDFRVCTRDIHRAIQQLESEEFIEQPPPKIDGLEIIERIGRGGSGTVYKAKQIGQASRIVAVKVFAPNSGRVDHMLREARALARLNHPGIATLYSVGQTDDGRTYVLLEYVDGERLTDYVKAHKPNLGEILELFHQICEAVAYANENGVIHRDLKPANILIKQTSSGPLVKVLDFSIARSLSVEEEQTINSETMLAGTPEYMSPEQADPELGPCTTRSDVFSLGTVLYELLAGVHPYVDGERPRPSMLSILQAVRDSEPTPPSVARLKYHQRHGSNPWGSWSHRMLQGDLDAIVLRSQRTRPSDRYPTARAMLEDLKRYKRSEPIDARRISTLWRFKKGCQRHPVITTGVTLTLVSFASIAIISWLGYQQERASTLREARAHSQTRLAFATSAIGRGDLSTARRQLDEIREDHRDGTWTVVSEYVDQSRSATLLDEQGIADLSLNNDLLTVAGRSGAIWQARLGEGPTTYVKPFDRSGVVHRVLSGQGGSDVYVLADDRIEFWREGKPVAECEWPSEVGEAGDYDLVADASDRVWVMSPEHSFRVNVSKTGLSLEPSSDSFRDSVSAFAQPDLKWSLNRDNALVLTRSDTGQVVTRLRGHAHSSILARPALGQKDYRLVTGDAAGYVRIWEIPGGLDVVAGADHVLGAGDDGWLTVDGSSVGFGQQACSHESSIDTSQWWQLGEPDGGGLVRWSDGQIELISPQANSDTGAQRLPFAGVISMRPVLNAKTRTIYVVDQYSAVVSIDLDTFETHRIEAVHTPITAIGIAFDSGDIYVAEGRSLVRHSAQGARDEIADINIGTQFIRAEGGRVVACTNSGFGVLSDERTHQTHTLHLGTDIRDLEILSELGLIIVGRGDGTLGLYSLATGEETASLPLFDSPVLSVSYGSQSVLRAMTESNASSEVYWLDLARDSNH